MRRYELTTIEGFTMQSWLVTRPEQNRFVGMARRWKKENPKSNLVQEMIAESLIRLHIFEQRLVDRRVFFDGEKTDYQQVADRMVDVSTEDLQRQSREFEKYMPLIQRWKLEWAKLALAQHVSLSIVGDAGNIHSLMGALNAKERRQVEEYRVGDNGSSDQMPNRI